ncbi:MAG TPA: hypothetical protein PK993_04315 [Clostridia bacterium]|nr:hypothetical protein [Clostridia bacterium]
MENAINVISIIIVSMGGMGTIIIGISKYLANILANNIEEKYKNKMSKDVEEFKGKINERLNKLDKIEEKALYVSKINYENEFKIYMEIWPKLNDCYLKTIILYPMSIENVPIDEKELEEYKKNKYENFCKGYNEFSICIDKYAPFYMEEFYNDLNLIRRECFAIGDKYAMYEFDVKYNESFSSCRDLKMTNKEWEEIKEKEDLIKETKEKLLVKIRKYLCDLRL